MLRLAVADRRHGHPHRPRRSRRRARCCTGCCRRRAAPASARRSPTRSRSSSNATGARSATTRRRCGGPGPAAPRAASARPAACASARTDGHAGRHRRRTGRAARRAPSDRSRSPRLALAAAVAGRAGDAGARDASAMIAFGVEGRIGIRLSAGVSNGTVAALDVMRQAAFRRFPLRLGAYWPMPLGVGPARTRSGIRSGPDFLVDPRTMAATSWRSPSSCSGGLCRSAGADLALGWSVASTHHVYVRALARAGPGGLLRLRRQPRMVTRSGVRQAPTSRSL